MTDEQTISLWLDGALAPDALTAFEQRLAAEPSLRAAAERARQLDTLSRGLAPATGSFNADAVREQLGAVRPRRRWPMVAAVAAAAAVLIATHVVAFRLGGGTGAEPAAAPRTEVRARATADDLLGETETLLARAAQLDAQAPPETLAQQFGALQRDVRLAALPAKLEALPPARQDNDRAARLVAAIARLETLLDRCEDPLFGTVMAVRLARSTLAGEPGVVVLPATAEKFSQVTPVGNGRFRVYFLDRRRGESFVDEGTLSELRARHTADVVPPAKETK